jgi:hypothetical protein
VSGLNWALESPALISPHGVFYSRSHPGVGSGLASFATVRCGHKKTALSRGRRAVKIQCREEYQGSAAMQARSEWNSGGIFQSLNRPTNVLPKVCETS